MIDPELAGIDLEVKIENRKEINSIYIGIRPLFKFVVRNGLNKGLL